MHPILFQTQHLSIHTIWIFYALGIIGFTYATIKFAVKNGLKLQFISEQSWKLIFYALIGARIFAIAANYQSYFYAFEVNAFLRLFYLWDKGLNLYGALIGFFAYLFYSCRKNEQDFWKWLDTLIPSMIIGIALSHLGAFFEGINYGHETSLPWGVNFESPWVRYTVPIHPTQIYAFLYSVVIAIILIYTNQSKKIKEKKITGIIGIAGISAYSSLRFLEEFLRGDDTWILFGIRVPQIFALIIAIITGILCYLRYNNSPSKKTSK